MSDKKQEAPIEEPSVMDRMFWFVRGRKHAYGQVFEGEVGAPRAVLADLASFCRATETTFHPDPRVAAMLEGRREVWLRITQHLNLTPEQVFQLANEGKTR